MKIDEKTQKEVKRLVSEFIKRHAERDEAGKFTGTNPVLKVNTPNLVEFLDSDEFREIGRLPIPENLKRRKERREFHDLIMHRAKHMFKESMNRDEYNDEFEDDPNVMVENYKEYARLKKERGWY